MKSRVDAVIVHRSVDHQKIPLRVTVGNCDRKVYLSGLGDLELHANPVYQRKRNGIRVNDTATITTAIIAIQFGSRTDAERFIVNAHFVIYPVAQKAQNIPDIEGLFDRAAHFSDFKCHLSGVGFSVFEILFIEVSAHQEESYTSSEGGTGGSGNIPFFFATSRMVS